MKRKTLFSAVYGAALVLVICSNAHAAGLGGSWSGQVTQDQPPSTYPVEMQLFGNVGNIGYASLGCGGNLQFIRADGKTYWYGERLTYGKDKCIDGGTIHIRSHPLGGNSWEWNWNGSGVSVRGVLSGSGVGER